ncbi:MAG TPA: hypothetical protein VF612_13655 [Jatrophihabitans sp.]
MQLELLDTVLNEGARGWDGWAGPDGEPGRVSGRRWRSAPIAG